MKNLIYITLLMLFALYSCEDPYKNTTYQVYDVNPISTYLDSRPDDFSEWVAILKYADLYNAMNLASSSFTAFCPTNKAVAAFYSKKGVNSIQELGKSYARDIVKYHLVADSINLDKFITGGKLPSMTVSGDYLTVSFDTTSTTGGGFNSVYLNKEAHVKEFAIQATNGYVYVLDDVMIPIVETVYQKLAQAGNYTIFSDALQQTTWKDSLNIVYDTIKLANGSISEKKRNFTLLAVPDEVFAASGITSVGDLASKLKAGSDYSNTGNALFKYMAYHTLSGNYSIDNLKTFDGTDKSKTWETLADSVFQVSLQDDGKYYINYKGGETIRANFTTEKSDVAARNGVIHALTGYMPIYVLIEPQTVYFDFCNYPDVNTYIKLYGTSGQVYQTENATTEYRTPLASLTSTYTYELGPSGPASTSSYNYLDYFTVKTSNWSSCLYSDQLILNLGYMGHVSMKTPTIIAGKYKVTLNFCYATSMDFMRTSSDGSNGGQMQFTFDGEKEQRLAPYSNVPANTLDDYKAVLYDELEFTKTSSHTLKIVVMDPAASTNSKFRIQLDYLLFEPIK
jgi:uncharacterized surface protein with fasciclin (FAS1) repeats